MLWSRIGSGNHPGCIWGARRRAVANFQGQTLSRRPACRCGDSRIWGFGRVSRTWGNEGCKMTPADQGRAELRDVRRRGRALFWAVVLFSVFVNLLMLTGPLFMLQVYDRVMARRVRGDAGGAVRSGGLPLADGRCSTIARGRVMARVGARFQAALDAGCSRRCCGAPSRPTRRARPGLRDIEAVQRLLHLAGAAGAVGHALDAALHRRDLHLPPAASGCGAWPAARS